MEINTQYSSPNFGPRRGEPTDILVIHYTAMSDLQKTIERLCDPVAAVSSHYLISRTGEVFQLVDESERAWHAGVSKWRSYTDVNSHSVGIELDNTGRGADGIFAPYPEVQIQSLIELSKEICDRHPIPVRNVIGHSDVAPPRKIDPGNVFPWAQLAGEGLGIWPSDVKPLALPSLRAGDQGEGVRDMQQNLQKYGYGIDVDGMYGLQTQQVVTAFQRHFRQSNTDGVADAETLSLLAWLNENA